MQDTVTLKRKRSDESELIDHLRHDFEHVKAMLHKSEGRLKARADAEIAASDKLARELRATEAALESARLALLRKF
ncbi:MAG: hypothetical protein M3Q32_09065 [Pseudomonadota bacterium]|nr:hypothetical protein [Burkholderiales bacterium]MDQ3196489.1 hypothetical protein [Pseudomonadota bacterium]